VVVTVTIDRDGNVSDAQIFRSVLGLDAAALTAARNKKFTPGRINGLPVITKMNIPIVFSLSDVQTGQTTGSTGGSRQSGTSSGEVVDLTGAAVRIKAEPDRPRVNIISDRIKPKFDNINLDKSFLPELRGEGEHIVIRKLEPEEQFETIEVKNLLNKTR
jgi:TonB family protein